MIHKAVQMILLAELASLGVRAARGRVEVVQVGTAEEFKAAIDRGTPHIEITAHLDLTVLAPESSADLFSPLLAPGETLQSITGNCASAPPAIRYAPPLNALKPRQCLLTVHGKRNGLSWPLLDAAAATVGDDADFLTASGDGTGDVWLNNVYVRAPRGGGSAARLSYAALLDWGRAGATLWLTVCTLQGGETALSAAGAAVYAADSEFTDANATGVVASSAPVSLYRCTLGDNRGAGVQAQNVGSSAASDSHHARVRAQGCIWAGNTVDLSLWKSTPLYTDTPPERLTRGPRSQGQVEALSHAGDAFDGLTSGNAAFMALRAAVQEAPRVGPPGPPAKHPTSIIVGSVLGGIALLAFCVACCGLARTRRRRKALQQRPGAIQSVKSFEAQPAEASAPEGAPELPPITAATAGPVSPPSAHGSSGEFLTPRAADADAQAAVRAAAEAHLAAEPNAGRPYVEAG